MLVCEALTLLGLSSSDHHKTQAINSAWRRKVLTVHPDKSMSHDATYRTQQLNQAKDLLLTHYEDLLTERKCPAEASEKEQKAAQAQHKHCAKKRKKRAEGSRVHRKIQDYTEGKALIEEMETFFMDSFISNPEYVSLADIMHLFMKSRKKITSDLASDLDKRLFHRHARRLFAAAWPSTHYTKHRNKWSFYGVAIKIQ